MLSLSKSAYTQKNPQNLLKYKVINLEKFFALN